MNERNKQRIHDTWNGSINFDREANDRLWSSIRTHFFLVTSSIPRPSFSEHNFLANADIDADLDAPGHETCILEGIRVLASTIFFLAVSYRERLRLGKLQSHSVICVHHSRQLGFRRLLVYTKVSVHLVLKNRQLCLPL